MSSYKNRISQFNEILADPIIDLLKFKTLCFEGIPDHPSLRSLSWKILLEYLPLKKSDRKMELSKHRLVYKNYVKEIVAHPDHSNKENNVSDHPLNMCQGSQWKTYFKDNEVLLQIDKDVRRLCPDISFFQQETSYSIYTLIDEIGPCETLTKRVDQAILETSVIGTTKGGLRNAIIKKYREEDYTTLEDGKEAHWQVVERILFIYAKLNPGLAYVQGMNEIIGPLYYTFASDPDLNWQEHAEADCFFCFTNLMGEIRDHFIKTLDDSPLGIGQHMNKLFFLLQTKDAELWKDLEAKQMKPQFFAFRWITLLLSPEFNLPDVIRLWDSLFADTKRFEFLLYVCVAMLVLIREQIFECDFPKAMKLIQNFPHETYDMSVIIRKAEELRVVSSYVPVQPDGDLPSKSKETFLQRSKFKKKFGIHVRNKSS
ncbi:TBC1 domain family member 13 isoform X2 [Hydra vulgaris]|uniref:TBC1 domain family member 13 isoform X2 n=1 Tax=Hydra vulgaris TaxID=6087 RepID=A0ABM4BCZ4_HYDVU